jgi:hypothetical protein
VELGLPGPLFQHNFSEFGALITDSWVKSAWQELMAETICVNQCTHHLVLARHEDRFLIEAFHRSGYRKKQLVRFN